MKGRLLRLAVVLLAAILLAPLFKDFVREALLLPLLYAAWLGSLVLESVPQVFIWALFCAAALLIGLRSLRVRPAGRTRRANRTGLHGPAGRIERWARLVSQARQDSYARWRLAGQLRHLALPLLYPGQPPPIQQIRQEFEAGQLELPADILAYFRASLVSFSYFTPPSLRFGRKAAPTPLDLDPERVVRFLEEYHDG